MHYIMKTTIKQQIDNYIHDNQSLIEGNVAEHLLLTAQSVETGYQWYLTQEEAEVYDIASAAQQVITERGIEQFIKSNYNYPLTFDVHFEDGIAGNEKGFKATFEYCKNYIQENNGTTKSYFEDYKGGTVSIICNETCDTVYSEEVR